MAAIITETFRRNSAKLLLNDITSSTNKYYVGIGKSDDWYEPLSIGTTAPFPAGTDADTFNATQALTNLIKVTGSTATAVIPRVRAVFGKKYKIYDPYDPSCFYRSDDLEPCYVVTESGIFLCVDKVSSDTTLEPDALFGSNPDDQFIGLTNYIEIQSTGSTGTITWAYLGEYDKYDPINSEQFVKVSLGSIEADMSLTEGLIYGLKVINGGIYPNTLTSGISATLKVYGQYSNGNNIAPVSITINPTLVTTPIPGTTNVTIASIHINGLGYQGLLNYAAANVEIEFTGITPTQEAIVAPLISPILGFASTPSEVLPTWYVGIVANTNTSEPDTFSQYSQVSLVRNPKNQSDVILDQTVYNTLKSFRLSDGVELYDLESNGILPGSIITQEVGSYTVKVGIVDSINYTDRVIYYTQNIKYGYAALSEGAEVSFILPDTTVVLSGTFLTADLESGAYKHGTGEIVFLENRSPIVRTADQNEELKLIIQL